MSFKRQIQFKRQQHVNEEDPKGLEYEELSKWFLNFRTGDFSFQSTNSSVRRSEIDEIFHSRSLLETNEIAD